MSGDLKVVIGNASAREADMCRLRLLADIGEVSGTSLSRDGSLTAFARAAVRHFADTCIIMLDDGAGGSAQVVVEHSAGTVAGDRHPADMRMSRGVTSAITRTEPVLLAGPALARLGVARAATAGGDSRPPRSGISAPFALPGGGAGTVIFIAMTREYDTADLDTAGRAVQRLRSALQNAALYETAQRTLKAHDETLSFVSHDLRNPLNVIQMAAELLLEQGMTEEPRLRWLHAIMQSAERMNTLISDLLTAARADAGAPALHPRLIRVDILVREAVTSLEHAALRKGIHLVTEAPGPSVEVVADADSIVRALANLIGNAIKHTPEGGSVTVGASAAGDSIHFSVRDTGAGIPIEHIPHLFERFWQAPGSDRGGAGLGLAIVKGVVESHRGEVWVESEPGRGSTFHFSIPAATVSLDETVPLEPGLAASARRRDP